MSRHRATELLDEARALSGDFDKLSQAVAERVGLTSTELLAMDLISRGPDVTAGRLATELNLTTGAITGLIDRLERGGYARRHADATDRRRVLVTSTAKEARLSALYSPLSRSLRKTVAGYSDAELSTLIDFLRKLRAAVAESAEAIRAGGPSRKRSARPKLTLIGRA
jgi:DNA-binding MarR family transcriptional regulator